MALVQLNNDKASNTSVELDNIQNKFDPVTTSTSTIKIIFYVLIGWIVLVTVVLIVVATITYRRWRRDRSSNLLDNSSIRSRSESQSGSLADVEGETTAKKPLGGNLNGAFTVEQNNELQKPGLTNSAAIVHSTAAGRSTLGMNTLRSVDSGSSVFHSPVRL